MMRVAAGTASVLGLSNIKMAVSPTTAHIMTPGRCLFDCKFCTQAKTSSADQKLLSRISWPEFQMQKVLIALEHKQEKFKRVCLQVVHSEGHEGFLKSVKGIRAACDIPVSVDLKADNMGTIQRTFDAAIQIVC